MMFSRCTLFLLWDMERCLCPHHSGKDCINKGQILSATVKYELVYLLAVFCVTV